MSMIGLNELRKRVVIWPAVVAMICLYAVVRAQNSLVEFVVQKGHSDWVNSVTFSPDGKMLASGSNDKTIKLWNVSTGQIIRTLYGNLATVHSVAFSLDGKMLASGSEDKTIQLWEVSSGQLIRTLSSGNLLRIRSVVFSPDGKVLASGSWDNTIKLWDANNGQLLRTLSGDSPEPTTIAVAPQSNNANTTTANTETPKPPTTVPQDTTQPKLIITSPPLTRGQGVKLAAAPSLKQSDALIAKTQSKYYHYAAVWLGRVKAAYVRMGRTAEWQSYLAKLKEEYRRRPALLAQLARL